MTMLNSKHVIVVLLLIAGLGACSSKPEHSDPKLTIISVIGTNDLHGAILPVDGYGGLGVFSGYVNNLRARRAADGGAVMLIDAGDMWQGTLESNLGEGAAVVQAYNALGYDAATIGNHEFDYGPTGPQSTPTSESDDARGALKARIAEANFPVLSANLIDENTGKPVDWTNTSPSAMVDVAGISVGIVGVITRGAFARTHSLNIKGLRIDPLVSSIQREAEQLRRNGATVVIVTAHAGSACREFLDPDDLDSCLMEGEILQVAQQLPAGLVDIIVAGHVHKGIAHNINGISVISSYSRGTAFGRVDLAVDRVQMAITNRSVFPPEAICEFRAEGSTDCSDDPQTSPRARYAGAVIARDKNIEAAIAPAIANVKQYKERKLPIVVEPGFTRSTTPESALGNLLTDAILESAADADVAIHNAVGGIRANLTPGPLTYGSIYEVFPFDNRMVMLTISAAELRAVFANQFRKRRWDASVAGLSVAAECRGSELVVSMYRSNGSSVADQEQLLIATTDFVATGGDNIFTPIMPPGGFAIDPDAPLFRHNLVAWFSKLEGSLRLTDFYDPAAPRFDLPGPTPITCTGDAT